MQVNFEHLELLPTILKKLELIEIHLQNNYSKRWLNVKEVSEYIGYSKDRIYKLKAEEWIEDYHYYKKTGKLIFDSHMIDKWIMGDNEISNKMKQRTTEIIDSILSDIQNK